jgi:hypothetical protein
MRITLKLTFVDSLPNSHLTRGAERCRSSAVLGVCCHRLKDDGSDRDAFMFAGAQPPFSQVQILNIMSCAELKSLYFQIPVMEPEFSAAPSTSPRKRETGDPGAASSGFLPAIAR